MCFDAGKFMYIMFKMIIIIVASILLLVLINCFNSYMFPFLAGFFNGRVAIYITDLTHTFKRQ